MIRSVRTGFPKAALYVRIALGVAARYALRPGLFGWSPVAYVRFLLRALRLLLVFRHNRPMRTPQGWKLHLYLPAYPSEAFFHTVEAKLIRRPPGPSTVVYSITKACRYRCPHCYQRNDTGKDVSDEGLCETARRLQDVGVAFFDIEGGEPFLRYERLLRLVSSLDARSEVWVNTTGDGVTTERLRELRRAGTVGVMVSIHSPSPESHDAFCGIPGAFDTACQCVRMASEAGLVPALNTVLGEQDIRDGKLDALMQLADDLGCHYVQLIHPKPCGAWLGRETDMQTDPALIERVWDSHRLYNSVRAPTVATLAAQVFEEAENVLGCTAGGIDRFYVGANGELQPCEFLNISFGNLNEEPFDVVFGRMRDAFPYPCTDWLCCTQGAAIERAIAESADGCTPLTWPRTRELVATWQHGNPTPVYEKLGIYTAP